MKQKKEQQIIKERSYHNKLRLQTTNFSNILHKDFYSNKAVTNKEQAP